MFDVTSCWKEEVLEEMLDIDNNKAKKRKSIPLIILKTVKHFIATHLCQISNLSFNKGVFLECLKGAWEVWEAPNWIAETLDPSSLPSNVDKIIEKLIHERMVSFLNEMNLLYMKQFVFRTNYSTTHAVITLIENIEKAIGNK